MNHFFKGYVGTFDAKEGLISDPKRVGRVRLDSFLKIVQALGYDVEIVLREKPGRGEL